MKKIFGNSKNVLLKVAGVAAAVVLLVTGTSFASKQIAENNSIGRDNAQKFAFADAGVDPAEALLLRTEFDREDGQFVYEVEFEAKGSEYEYHILATDGTVVKKNIEDLDKVVTNEAKSGAQLREETNRVVNNHEQKPDQGRFINMQDAKEIAFKDAGVTANEVRFNKTQGNSDDGVKYFEVDFYTETTEYEYDIRMSDGTILDKDVEKLRTQKNVKNTTKTQTSKPVEIKPVEAVKPQPTTSSKTETSSEVSLEAAKAIAYKDAGVKASDVKVLKAERDSDDGVVYYDIEFTANNNKYEYEIRVSNGRVLDKDVEKSRTENKNTSTAKKTENNYIGVEKAKQIAVNHAGVGMSEVRFSKAKLDREDGVMMYEIEFYKGNMEYEYQIVATNGNIHEWESDLDD